MTTKMTTKQAELATKYAAEIEKYVSLVRKASEDQDAAEAAGADGYEMSIAYAEPMYKATEIYNDIENAVTNDCYSIPFKAARNKTIDAFMAYVRAQAQ